MAFIPVSKELLFKRNEPGDPRWGEKVLLEGTSDWVLRGYPDDEGIKLNGGRLGASEAPDKIRQAFYRTTWGTASPSLCDLGNLSTEPELGLRHEECRKTLGEVLKSGRKAICLGGGHDYGFPDGAAFLDQFKTLKPLVLNFDAHLDVRPLDRGFSSGTPFFRLLTEFSDFEFVQVGIQPQCNSENYLKWCTDKGAKVLTWPEVLLSQKSLTENLRTLLKLSGSAEKVRRPLFVSLDIDCFNNAIAPGCSQSWPTGLTANDFYPCLELLKEFFDIKLFSIYEVSPPLDHDSRTSKLAAQWIHQLLSQSLNGRVS